MGQKQLLEKYHLLWKKIDKGVYPFTQTDVEEINAIRKNIPDDIMGIFYFQRACYDSAYELLRSLSSEKAKALVRVCEKRLGINQPIRTDLPKLDLEEIRPGITEKLSRGKKKSLGEGRIGWFKEGKWEITTLSHCPIIRDLQQLNEFENGLAEVTLFNNERVIINRHGVVLLTL